MKKIKIENNVMLYEELTISEEEFKIALAVNPNAATLFNPDKEMEYVVKIGEEGYIGDYYACLIVTKNNKLAIKTQMFKDLPAELAEIVRNLAKVKEILFKIEETIETYKELSKQFEEVEVL